MQGILWEAEATGSGLRCVDTADSESSVTYEHRTLQLNQDDELTSARSKLVKAAL